VSLLFYDPIFLEHDTGPGHPERAERLRAITRRLDTLTPRPGLRLCPEATREQLLRVHTPEHLETLRRCCETGTPLDGDTPVSPHSYEAALRAAGAGVAAVDAAADEGAKSAFCAVRPPGHHATAERAMGFCLINNVAVAARHAQERGFERVFIVDFDVHHGNGTQGIFYDDPSVFYFSSHQYPAYPGSGDSDETGSGHGQGYTLNFPLLPESGDEEILPIYRQELPGAVRAFRPDMILVSAGYDLHERDPLASLYVSTEAVGAIVEAIMTSADVPKIFFLEGGYDAEALAECVGLTLQILSERE